VYSNHTIKSKTAMMNGVVFFQVFIEVNSSDCW
jgi:hypothetical protein